MSELKWLENSKERVNTRPVGTRPDLYVVEATSLDFTRQVLDEFDASVIRCLDKIGPGVYHYTNKFMFMLPGTNASSIKETIFMRKNVRLHKSVAALELKTSSKSVLVKVFNVYKNKYEITVRLNVNGGGKLHFLDMFPDFDMNVSSE